MCVYRLNLLLPRAVVDLFTMEGPFPSPCLNDTLLLDRSSVSVFGIGSPVCCLGQRVWVRERLQRLLPEAPSLVLLSPAGLVVVRLASCHAFWISLICDPQPPGSWWVSHCIPVWAFLQEVLPQSCRSRLQVSPHFIKALFCFFSSPCCFELITQRKALSDSLVRHFLIKHHKYLFWETHCYLIRISCPSVIFINFKNSEIFRNVL